MPQLWSFSQLYALSEDDWYCQTDTHNTATDSISYNFHQLASVIFRKYPNDYAQHVVSVDTIDRSIDPETGVLRTERIIGVQQPAPRWVSAVSSPCSACTRAVGLMVIYHL